MKLALVVVVIAAITPAFADRRRIAITWRAGLLRLDP
jgi:hypothetical protein